MNQKLVIVISLLCFIQINNPIYANSSFDGSARHTAMGGASIALGDLWSALGNQAGLAQIKMMSFGVGYSNHFLMHELSTKSILFALPYRHHVFALNVYHSGYNLYHEKQVGISYARGFGKRLNIGFKLSYLYFFVQDYGQRTQFTEEGGFQYQLTSKASVAMHVKNLLGNVSNAPETAIDPVALRLGYMYNLSNQVLLSLQIEKESWLNPNVKSGLEYKVNTLVSLRSGFSFREVQGSFGFGFSSGRFQVDVSAITHPVLGYSPHISLNYAW